MSIPPIVENTWAKGLNPKYAAMSKDEAELFAMVTMGEVMGGESRIPFPEDLFMAQVLQKRIDVLKLPIKFSNLGYMAANSLVDRIGAAVVLLVDCLNAFEGRTVTAGMLAQIYPWGFYDEATLIRYIDEYMKPRKVKWSEVY